MLMEKTPSGSWKKAARESKLAKLDRNELIRRLKTVKDPRERDQILLLLTNREEDRPPGPERAVPSVQTGPFKARPLPDQPKSSSEQSVSRGSGAGQDLPAAQATIGRLIGYIFPLFFLIAGAVFTLELIKEVGQGKPFQQAIAENPTGIFLIFFGLAGLIKNKKAKRPPPNI